MEEAPPSLSLNRWTSVPVLAIAWISFASGVGQFGVVAALGDVAKSFGHIASGATIANQAGLSGSSLGLGLAIIRLASLGALPLAAIADRLGRRIVLLAITTVGLTITLIAAASPGYWWFVVIFATGRPMLSAANSLCSVLAAEETSSKDRAKAMAAVAAAYGVGAGVTAIIHSLAGSTLGFRGICLLAAVPLATLPFAARKLKEPVRFIGVAQARAKRQSAGKQKTSVILAAMRPPYRSRMLIVALLAFFLSVVTGPANTFVFLYAQNILHVAGTVTALMVVCAGATGLLGLFAGRWSADHFGRRKTASFMMMLLAVTQVVTYSGSKTGMFAGYVIGVGIAATFAPAAGALANELFPTEVRASVGGWNVAAGVLGAAVGLLVFGLIADIGNRFGVAAAVTFLPSVLIALVFFALPETNGKEPEEIWPATP
ncbi:MAG: MFS transporter [Acidimicrobiales bacterium]|jgi:MFS family permease